MVVERDILPKIEAARSSETLININQTTHPISEARVIQNCALVYAVLHSQNVCIKIK
jgi:hypothetical protein